jgi:ribosomal protein S18 acetylase RimI-like enzyme
MRRIGGCAALAAATWVALASSVRAQDDAIYEGMESDEPPAPALAPPEHATLRYHLRQTVSNGGGEYEGWGDSLVSVGDYETHGNSVHAHYDWRYASPDRTDEGIVDRDVTFDVATRDYVGRTDLDDYDDETGPLATWLWVPTTLTTGDHVRILEETFDVGARVDVSVAGEMRHAIYAHTDSSSTRDDEYGSFRTTFTDEYWFDATTGMFLLETRTEDDSGTYHGRQASFRMQLRVEVVDASYAPAVGPIPPSPQPDAFASSAGSYDEDDDDGPGFAMLAVLVVPFLIVFLVFLVGGRSAANPFKDRPFDVHTLGPGTPLPDGLERLSPHLGPFLPHIAEVARRSGNAISIARARGSTTVEGIAIDDADSRMLAVYARDPDCAEALRHRVDRLELISETRYPPLPSVVRALQQAGRSEPRQYAYNLYETFEIMERKGEIDPPDYDTSVVTRMRPEDVPEAAGLAERVYSVPCEAFLRASLEADDVAFVAKEDGRIVGLALATVVGTEARLHTLLVDPDARSRGLGKELYRARLRALADLGVDRVITEVAVNNPAAIEIARQFGMQTVGEMYVQSARPSRTPIGVVRR